MTKAFLVALALALGLGACAVPSASPSKDFRIEHSTKGDRGAPGENGDTL